MADYGSNEWVISLWLNNDPGAQEWANYTMQSAYGDPYKRGALLRDAFDEFYVEPIESDFMKGIVRDMINHTDWDQIAEETWVDD